MHTFLWDTKPWPAMTMHIPAGIKMRPAVTMHIPVGFKMWHAVTIHIPMGLKIAACRDDTQGPMGFNTWLLHQNTAFCDNAHIPAGCKTRPAITMHIPMGFKIQSAMTIHKVLWGSTHGCYIKTRLAVTVHRFPWLQNAACHDNAQQLDNTKYSCQLRSAPVRL